ncbi:peptide deformylase [Thermosulfuriphilus ammonigenes]|uniref:Peptide deformylase n=1 Tax=Thermosulfuriphilus ammonigenes TaxID=1936021 RepID=A0A6G7PWA2_9BACT|nr:peptide deformylase [Thermosulfuriphilus ammonigenes]MBA2848131.1 peptide deformylase [Thermosulfuriphilus ammonigenes]QIJ71693.1 peptide deformylase [Thermosulfuriphilus ammonigenes]
MPKKKIVIYPDPPLRETASPVEEIDGQLQKLIDDMIETMYAAKGVGLAANQVGELKRLVVMDVSQKDGHPGEILVLINPEIIEAEGELYEEEGCLSLPGYAAKVKRHARVLARAYDRQGREFELEGEGLLARAIQHELDHLNGILFIDHLSPLKRALFRKKWKKIRPQND